MGRRADEHAVDRSRRLQARGGVDHVAGDKCLTFGRVRVERDERLPGVHRRTNLEPVLDQRVAHGERGPHCALRVVLVRDGRAEDGHHGVADELLDGAAEALELVPGAGVVRRERRTYVFGIGGLGTGRVADEVDEDDADDLALLACRLARRAERRAASGAEARVGLALAAAGAADDHLNRSRA